LIDLIINNEIKPAVNQIETHPFHQQIETQKFLQENNVQIESGDRLQKVKTIYFITSYLLQLERNIINQLHKLSFAGLHKEVLLLFQNQCEKKEWKRTSTFLILI
jgi:diketogulonate reductase-like aldo/keto reductase